MIPEAELVRKEFIVRQMDFPPSVSMTKKSLLRWCALSLGLISKNETRDKGFLALDALFTLIFSKKTSPTTLDIQAFIKEKYKTEMSEKLIRYHLNRLIETGIIERKGLKFSINPAPNTEKRNSLRESFEHWFIEQIKKEMKQTSEALEKLQKSYEEKK
jgi:hypothetical protein